MTDAGFTISGSDHPISPVMLGDEKVATAMARDLIAKGIKIGVLSFKGILGKI